VAILRSTKAKNSDDLFIGFPMGEHQAGSAIFGAAERR
jgi:hypothetical protein